MGELGGPTGGPGTNSGSCDCAAAAVGAVRTAPVQHCVLSIEGSGQRGPPARHVGTRTALHCQDGVERRNVAPVHLPKPLDGGQRYRSAARSVGGAC